MILFLFFAIQGLNKRLFCKVQELWTGGLTKIHRIKSGTNTWYWQSPPAALLCGEFLTPCFIQYVMAPNISLPAVGIKRYTKDTLTI
jgi:hypothetical protein